MTSTANASPAAKKLTQTTTKVTPRKTQRPVQKKLTPAAPVKLAKKVQAANKASPKTQAAPAKSPRQAPSKTTKRATTPSKTVTVAKTEAIPKAEVSAKPAKDKKVKVVRDSFTIPKAELMNIGELKKRALGLGIAAKKSELIRAGLLSLSSLNDTAFKNAIDSVPIIKTGRPAKA